MGRPIDEKEVTKGTENKKRRGEGGRFGRGVKSFVAGGLQSQEKCRRGGKSSQLIYPHEAGINSGLSRTITKEIARSTGGDIHFQAYMGNIIRKSRFTPIEAITFGFQYPME
ncbi:hypothetical protein VTO42DRAFT_3662 [Malbranchea cinnamomea]